MNEIKNPVLKQIWQDRYCKNNETLDDNYRRVAKYLANSHEQEEDFYYVISNGYFLPAGRTMSNSGIGDKLTLNNCFTYTRIDDDINSIFDAVKVGAITHKAGGGIGYEFSSIRPSGSLTSNDAVASGPVSFIEVFDAQTSTILQGGRRGANMGILNIYHPDIRDFIHAKDKEGKLTHFNLSIMVDDDFMNAVENDEEIFLHFPVYDDMAKIEKNPDNWKRKEKVSARELWEEIMTSAYNTGEPGIFFYNTMNNDNNLQYTETIVSTNPCVSGDTLILTRNGYQRIDECVNETLEIWNGFEWSEVTPKITGKNQKMLKFTFSDGTELRTTNYHKFILKNGDRVEAKDLVIGDKIAKFSFPVIDGRISDIHAYTKGFYCGDGTYKKESKKSLIYLYDKKKDLLDFLWASDVCQQESCQNRIQIVIPEVLDKEFVPSVDYDIKARLDWLAGLLDSDGCINSVDGGLSISSINKNFLIETKLMLNTLGISSCLSLMHHSGLRPLPSSNRQEYKYYNCQDSYRLTIRASMTKKLLDLGLNCHRLQIQCNPNRDASRFIQITNIEPQEELEEFVYCFNEPKNHSGIFNGIMTAQCSEYVSGIVYGQGDPHQYGGACNLGSLLLHNFVVNPFTPEALVDWETLEMATRIGVDMLDRVININKFPHPIYENYQKLFRTIGLGVTGLADMLVMLNMKYSSQEARDFVDHLMERIAYFAYDESCELAREFGSFNGLQKDLFLQSGYLKKQGTNWDTIREKIAKNGIRNARILSVAPTGTMSLTFGNNCSSGIEPIFQLEYERKVKIGGQSDDDTQIIKMRDFAYNVWKEKYASKENDNFETALNLSVDSHIAMLATIARHVDMSVSKTINVPESYTLEQTKDIYTKCWKSKIKGCTIFRPNAIRQGILISNSSKKTEEKNHYTLGRGDIVKVDNTPIGLKRDLQNGCGRLHVQAFFDPITGLLQEIYCSKGSDGGCQGYMVGLSRMISLAARGGIAIEDIIDQLESTTTCPSYAVRKAVHKDTSPGSSCPSAIGRALKDMSEEMLDWIDKNEGVKERAEKQIANDAQKCPDCGAPLVQEGGCIVCKNCGWSRCE